LDKDNYCEKCSVEDHEGVFCRCESRNIALAKELRQWNKSPWERSGIIKQRICHEETENNIVFCAHGDPTQALVFCSAKDFDIPLSRFEVNFCPFCGFTNLPKNIDIDKLNLEE
jgi:hypothetical protein